MGFIYTKSGKLAKRLYFGAVLLFEGLYYTFKNRVLADGGTFVENELPTISQDAKLVLTTNAYKAGKLYSAVPNDGTGDFTVDRNSTATYVDEDGLIKTALANVPRIDWSTGVPVISRELQSINLIPYSEDFSNAAWNKTNSPTITINAEESPTGEITATKITGSGTQGVYELVSTAGSVPHNRSVYIKLFSGAGTGILKDPASSITIISFTATNKWVRYDFNQDSIGSGDAGIWIDNIDGTILIWGAQLEQASTATSYIPTNGTTVTRLADNISVPTPAGVTAITETIDGVEQTPITTIPATYSLPEGNINKVKML